MESALDGSSAMANEDKVTGEMRNGLGRVHFSHIEPKTDRLYGHDVDGRIYSYIADPAILPGILPCPLDVRHRCSRGHD